MMSETVSMTGIQAAMAAAAPTPSFIQTDLISDVAMPGVTTDPNLVNPWGISSSPTSPFWISENNSGLTSVDSVTGGKVMINSIPAVTIPGPMPGTTSSPTGQVFNSFPTAFKLPGGAPSSFLFATEDGTIAGWNSGTQAVLAVNDSTNVGAGDAASMTGAVYKGLAIGMSASGPTLYAANFRHGTVDMFDSNFQAIKSFTDPTVPAGYAPFNVQVLGGKLYVTYAQQDAAKHDDVAGAGHGFVDAFDLNGNMLGRVGSGGTLDSPWGLALAPASFGALAGDLLVGNFGDGTINAFNPTTDQFMGQLTEAGKPIAIDGLWSLVTGNGGAGGDPNTIYFSAGPASQTHGLFGSIIAAPTPTA